MKNKNHSFETTGLTIRNVFNNMFTDNEIIPENKVKSYCQENENENYHPVNIFKVMDSNNHKFR
jgi:glutathione peroxidase-family protein